MTTGTEINRTTVLALDTNILVRLSLLAGSGEASVRAVKEITRAYVPYICMQNLAEFWTVATRPASVNGLGMSFETASGFMTTFRKYFGLLYERPATIDIWMELVTRYRVSGRRTHDARLAATVLSNNVNTLATFNTPDFQQFNELNLVELNLLAPNEKLKSDKEEK